MRSFIIASFCFFFLISALPAQDTLLFLTGKQKIVEVKEVNKRLLYISYQKAGKPDSKIKGIEIFDVYSVSFKDSIKMVTYIQDSSLGLILNEEDMAQFIKGEQYAAIHYKAVGYWVGGVAVGFASPLFLKIFYGFIPPAVYTGVSALIPPPTKRLAKRAPELYADKSFVDGYKNKAKKKSALASLYGSLIGLAGGIPTLIILSDEK